MDDLSSVTVRCVMHGCKRIPEQSAYEFEEVPAHVQPLAVLTAHTQHGSCVLQVEVDGVTPFEFEMGQQ